MGMEAYDLNRFAARPEREREREREKKPEAPKLKLVTKREKKQKRAKLLSTLRIAISAALVLGLVVGVLYTQTEMMELQTEINQQTSQLNEANATQIYLTNELENKANMQDVATRAAELGLVKTEKSQYVYMQLNKENEIEIDKPGAVWLWESAEAGVAAINRYKEK